MPPTRCAGDLVLPLLQKLPDLGFFFTFYPAEASKPEDWDEEEDGDWEPPKIVNPKCKDAPGCGEWKRPNKPVSTS